MRTIIVPFKSKKPWRYSSHPREVIKAPAEKLLAAYWVDEEAGEESETAHETATE